MKSHTDQRTYLCSLCGKDFKWLGNLKSHQKMHVGVNACARASHLKEIHPGEKNRQGLKYCNDFDYFRNFKNRRGASWREAIQLRFMWNEFQHKNLSAGS